MALEIVAATPGLWRDPSWTFGMPGVYALVVGASAYPHLDGGSAPAPDTFGMGQLVSSAGTAAALFRWLRQDFRHKDLPVVWCQLLLSPNTQEKADLDQSGLQHYGNADNDGFRNAIQRWTGHVPTAPPASQRSRTLFFFSGHGVLSNWRALLLPSDYLNPGFGTPHLENCISTRELQDWMEQSPVLEHLALIDACQNQFSPLASKGATANSCFPVTSPGGTVPRTAAALASTSPNAVAYQVGGRPYTFFGEAVLEALRGVAGGNDARVEFRELVDYVRPRVNVLLKQAGGAALDQTVRPRIEGDDVLVVTEIESSVPTAAGAPPPGMEAARRGPRGVPVGAAQPRRHPTDPSLALQATAARFDPALAVRESITLAALRQDFGQIHHRFGHEYASHPWRDGMQLYALQDGARIDADGSMVRSVERNDASSLIQVDLELAPRSGGVLLVFEGARYVQRERLAVALPTDTGGPVPIRLNLVVGPFDGGSLPPRIQQLEARLGPTETNLHYQYLWALMREADLGSLSQAAGKADPERLKAAAEEKREFPTAATAGMLLLARAGRLGDVKDWTRNLMHWFPSIPDGAVLWAESLRQALDRGMSAPFNIADPITEMAHALQTLEERGVPLFTDSLELSETLLRYVVRQVADGEGRAALLEMQRLLKRLFEVATPSGHFFTLAGLPRPAWLDISGGPLSVSEMRALLRPNRTASRV